MNRQTLVPVLLLMTTTLSCMHSGYRSNGQDAERRGTGLSLLMHPNPDQTFANLLANSACHIGECQFGTERLAIVSSSNGELGRWTCIIHQELAAPDLLSAASAISSLDMVQLLPTHTNANSTITQREAARRWAESRDSNHRFEQLAAILQSGIFVRDSTPDVAFDVFKNDLQFEACGSKCTAAKMLVGQQENFVVTLEMLYSHVPEQFPERAFLKGITVKWKRVHDAQKAEETDKGGG